MATHWGWYWKVKDQHQPRTLCSKLSSIDSFKFFKNPDFSGFTVQPIDIKATLHKDALNVTYGNKATHSYTILIDKQPCHFGGFRYFFKCPLCKCRMRMLYLTDKSIFLCRGCLNLSYKSQQLRPTLRYDYMNAKIKNIITSKGNFPWNKPKGMHAATYKRLNSLQNYYEQKSHQAMNTELRAWYGAKIEPHLDRYFDYAPERP